VLLVIGMTSIGLAAMLPYFAYVFWFLEPGNIIDRLRLHTTRLNRRGLATRSSHEVDLLQGRVLMQMEEITDIANNSIDGRDKIVAGHAVDALRDFLIDYIENKPQEDRPWYNIGRQLRDNPNFVAMDKVLMRDLEERRLWVEWKTLRQYLGVYNEALESMQEINSLVAIDTRYIGEAAAGKGETELVRTVFRFMNSYLRSAINHGSVRTAYNVLHQYRMMLETLLQLGREDLACEGVSFIGYYGRVAFEADLDFITQTAAQDIAELCKFSHRHGNAVAEKRILRQLLDLGAEHTTRGNNQLCGLKGVRKAQAKLAVYYLSVGAQANARMIAVEIAAPRPSCCAASASRDPRRPSRTRRVRSRSRRDHRFARSLRAARPDRQPRASELRSRRRGAAAGGGGHAARPTSPTRPPERAQDAGRRLHHGAQSRRPRRRDPRAARRVQRRQAAGAAHPDRQHQHLRHQRPRRPHAGLPQRTARCAGPRRNVCDGVDVLPARRAQARSPPGADLIKMTITGGVNSRIGAGLGAQMFEDEARAVWKPPSCTARRWRCTPTVPTASSWRCGWASTPSSTARCSTTTACACSAAPAPTTCRPCRRSTATSSG
jgi:hypothetical protein